MRDLAVKIKENLKTVKGRIEKAALSAGRDPSCVRLVVVTKTQPIDVIETVISEGATLLGENYAEEAAGKILALGSRGDLEWHMIGHVQSRKARLVCEYFDLLHSLDSVHIAEKINQHALSLGRVLPVLLEFNLGAEETKFGWVLGTPETWKNSLPDLERVLALPALHVLGIMVMPPLTPDLEQARSHFVTARRLQEYLSSHFPESSWEELSMGTSADYEVAAQEGATMLRIGQAILGPRPEPG